VGYKQKEVLQKGRFRHAEFILASVHLLKITAQFENVMVIIFSALI
jgi:hypothetical protein